MRLAPACRDQGPGPPSGTLSFVLTMIDVDVKPDEWSHCHYQFTIWALPTATISLAPDEKATTLTALLSKQALDRASLIEELAIRSGIEALTFPSYFQ